MGFVQGQSSPGVPLIKDGQFWVYTAMVDIGPNSNNGPGDQTKGILNWSANPIVVVANSTVGKWVNVSSFSVQYLPGLAVYVDSGTQSIGLFLRSFTDGPLWGLSSFGLNDLNPGLWRNLPAMIPYFSSLATPLVGAAAAAGDPSNQDLVFGDAQDVDSPHELTTEDGQVRVTVKYSIDDILV